MLAMLLAACGGAQAPDGAKYPPRKEGCEVTVFHEAPAMPTDNIGTVTATCDASLSDAECTRTLQDEACKLGGDIVWGVPDQPTLDLGKKRLSGRVAHTRQAK